MGDESSQDHKNTESLNQGNSSSEKQVITEDAEKIGDAEKPKAPRIELPKPEAPVGTPGLANKQEDQGSDSKPPGGESPARVVKKLPQHKGIKGMLFSMLMVGLGLGVGFVVLGKYLPKPTVPTGESPEASPSAQLVTPTEFPTTSVTEPELHLLTKEELVKDTDGDVLPDRLEEILEYDPQGNDCVRELGCGDFPTVPRAKLEVNMLFLLDASGSMGEKLEAVTKWDSAKKALLDLLDSGLPNFANMGLIVYGHKGTSDEADKQLSCGGAELVLPLAGVDVMETEKVINNIQPAGWTPIGGALKLAGGLLEGREEAQNFVILLSDGKETCGEDPIEVAKRLHESGIEVVTNVVGLVVSPEEKQQLELIAQSGGGRYYAANSREELEKALILSAEAIRLWDEVNRCILDNLSGYGQCINVQYLKGLNYMDRLRLYLGEETGSAAGLGYLEKVYEETYRRIWAKFDQLRQENWEQYDADLRKLYPR